MPFDDLDLEFEDEEEVARKKKGEAVQVDVDLEFQSPGKDIPRSHKLPGRPVQGGHTNSQVSRPMGEVRRMDEARGATSTGIRGQSISPRPQSIAPQPRHEVSRVDHRSEGSSALKLEPSDEVARLKDQLRRVEFESEVKVAVAECKTQILGDVLGDMKLLENQITQLLNRINTKHPDVKQEALMIKKLLADFTAKKRK